MGGLELVYVGVLVLSIAGTLPSEGLQGLRVYKTFKDLKKYAVGFLVSTDCWITRVVLAF
jgi:hypothetical protein